MEITAARIKPAAFFIFLQAGTDAGDADQIVPVQHVFFWEY